MNEKYWNADKLFLERKKISQIWSFDLHINLACFTIQSSFKRRRIQMNSCK